MEQNDRAKECIVSFTEMIDAMGGIDVERKRLFKEVYANAVNDRERATKLFDDLSGHIDEEKTNIDAAHTIHGATLTRYLERMHRSNEQLIKLAEMISDAMGTDENVNLDDVFSRIQGTDDFPRKKGSSKK